MDIWLIDTIQAAREESEIFIRKPGVRDPRRISPIIIAFVPICRSGWIAPTPAQSSHRKSVGSSLGLKWGGLHHHYERLAA